MSVLFPVILVATEVNTQLQWVVMKNGSTWHTHCEWPKRACKLLQLSYVKPLQWIHWLQWTLAVTVLTCCSCRCCRYWSYNSPATACRLSLYLLAGQLLLLLCLLLCWVVSLFPGWYIKCEPCIRLICVILSWMLFLRSLSCAELSGKQKGQSLYSKPQAYSIIVFNFAKCK